MIKLFKKLLLREESNVATMDSRYVIEDALDPETVKRAVAKNKAIKVQRYRANLVANTNTAIRSSSFNGKDPFVITLNDYDCQTILDDTDFFLEYFQEWLPVIHYSSDDATRIEYIEFSPKTN